jgi:hypothetical protein
MAVWKLEIAKRQSRNDRLVAPEALIAVRLVASQSLVTN